MNLIKSILIILIFTSLYNEVQCQFGVSLIYDQHIGATDWDETYNVNSDHIKANGIGAAVTYWFRLKEYRIEFVPELIYLTGDQKTNFDDLTEATMKWSNIGFSVNTNLYPFDFEGDCNCPTFGKDGSFFEKGFFIQISPGVGFFNNQTELEQTFELSTVYFKIGLGAGLDIGLAEFFTISPFIRYDLGLGNSWASIESSGINIEETKSTTKDLLLGLAMQYRLDYKRRRF